MVLMTLHLNLGAQDIAYRFGVSQSTVLRYFNKWINVMFVCLQPLVKWSGHDELRKLYQWSLGIIFKNALSS